MIAGRPEFTKLFIDGRYVDAASEDSYTAVTPVTGEAIVQVAAGGAEDVDRAVSAARRAFDDSRWADLSPRERKRILLRFAQLLVDNSDELASLITIDMGKPIGDAKEEVIYSARNLEWMAEAVDHMYGKVAPLGPKALGTITHEPVGVVGAIVSWNFPLVIPVWKMGPALASGNCVVLKPAEQSPLVALRIGGLASEAGIPAGAFNVVPGLGEVAGRRLAEHEGVDAITFTGSTAVGKLIMRYAADSNLKKVSLELGGKSPNVVLADAESPDEVASQTAAGIFANSGQVCDACSRLVVEAPIADELVERIVAATERWRPGDPFDRETSMGPVVDEAQMRRVLSYIDVGKSEGADVATGGKRILEETGGYYVEPTVLRGVDNGMRVAQDEIFGPVLSVISFAEEDEALRIAHETSYGLAAAVWTRDVSRALRIAKTLRAGSVWVNGYDTGDLTLPHGGFKQCWVRS